MSRLYYDNSKYLVEKAKLPRPDGIHCIICGGMLPKFKRKYCSDDCFNRWYQDIGGIKDWSILRQTVLKHDNFSCVECGGLGEEVHHIRAIHDGGEEFNPDNCITLCRGCHRKKHSKIGKIQRQHRILEYFKEK